MQTEDAIAPAPTSAPRQRVLSSTFVLAWLINFAGYFLFYLMVTTMAFYAVTRFAASDALGGLASSAFVIGATVARLFAGTISDRFGRRRVLWVSLILVAAVCGLYLVTTSLPALIAVRLIHGAAYAFGSTATMSLVQSSLPPARRAEGTGYFALGTTLAAAVGPALGLFIVNTFDYDALFWLAWITAGASLVLGLLVRTPDAPRPDAASRQRFSLRGIIHPAVVPIGVFMLLNGLCYSGVLTYLNVYADQRDVLLGASLFFVAYSVVMLVMRFVLGRLQDRRGDNVVMYIGLVGFTAAFGLISIATADWQIIVAGALTGLGWGTLMPASQVVAVNLVPEHRLATGISTLFLFMDIGTGLGPVVLGAYAAAVGYSVMFASLGGVVVLAGVLYQAVHGRHDIAKRRVAAG